jgi:hypothetical protein
MEQAQACYRSRSVNTFGDGFYRDKAALRRNLLFCITGYKRFPDSQSETTIGYRNQAVRHDYKSFFKRKNNEYK